MIVECNHCVNITLTESRIIEMMKLGMTNREIAASLGRSAFTVKTHVEHILEKTDARNRMQACAIVSRDETK